MIDELAAAMTGEMPSRAVHEIQAEIMAICNRLAGCAEAEEWLGVHNLSERLADLAHRGMYHASQKKAKEIAAFSLNGHRETESR